MRLATLALLSSVLLGPDALAQTAGQRLWALDVWTLPVGGALTLSAPAPNPANGSARLTLTLADAGAATAAVFDPLGRRVAVLHDGPLAAGALALAFDASALPAGVYVVRASADGAAVSRRLVVGR